MVNDNFSYPLCLTCTIPRTHLPIEFLPQIVRVPELLGYAKYCREVQVCA